MFLGFGVAFGLAETLNEVTIHAVTTGSSSAGLWIRLYLLTAGGWAPALGIVTVYVPLLFPDGHLPSPRWRIVAWTEGVAIAMLVVGSPFAADALSGIPHAPPSPFASLRPWVIGPLVSIGAVAFVAMIPLAAIGLFQRFRRSVGIERDQLKWFVFGVAVLAVFVVVGISFDAAGHPDARANVIGFGVFAIPISTGIAMLRHKLYDVDVVIRKTVVAALLVLVTVLAYAMVVGAFGRAATGREQRLFVTALLLGLAFRPIAHGARRFADRLVYGKRATPYEVLTEFSGRVGEAYAVDDVLKRMATVLAEGTGAERATVSLMIDGRLRPMATFPQAEPASGSSVDVIHQGEKLGALTVDMPASDPMDGAKQRLIEDLASQAGLVLRNVRLIEELKASRQRLVAAQDEERRKIERNIHDGAQQQLVALSVKLRLADGLVDGDVAKAHEMLGQLQTETNDALENLRDLARGIYPPLLADRGLGVALEAQARKSPVPTTVEANGIGRFPQEIEAAVYFSCLEALQNVAKYAGASKACIRLLGDDGSLRFEVEDNGSGFDPTTTSYGTGLQGMRDRLEALGGILETRSAQGVGTTVTGRVPVRTGP